MSGNVGRENFLQTWQFGVRGQRRGLGASNILDLVLTNFPLSLIPTLHHFPGISTSTLTFSFSIKAPAS